MNYCRQDGKIPADNTIGRNLLELVNTVPRLDREAFEEMLTSNMKVWTPRI